MPDSDALLSSSTIGQAMGAEELRAELMAIDGIAAAEVGGDEGAPNGIKIRLEAGADADAVGEAVRRVLAGRGMRSRVGGDKTAPASPPPPPGAPVVSIGRQRGSAETIVETSREAGALPVLTEVAPFVSGASLASLSVEEGRIGVTVTASARDGRSATRRSRSTSSGLEEAILGVVAELVHGADAPTPLLIAVEESTIEESDVVTVLVEVAEGIRHVGSAILDGGRAYAIATAMWAALRDHS